MFRDLRFYLWVAVLVAGFAYVAWLCHRTALLQSRHGGYGSILKMLAVTPLLFYLGPRHNFPTPALKARILIGALAGYLLPYFAGLHFIYLQRIPQINYSLTAQDLRRMPLAGHVIFLCIDLLILAMACYHFRLAKRAGTLRGYVASLLVAILVLVGISWLLSGRYYVHIHHYFFFGFFIPFARFKNMVSLAGQGFCTGIFVEGISEWGFSTLWYLQT